MSKSAIVPLNKNCQNQNKQKQIMFKTFRRFCIQSKIDKIQIRQLILGIESSCDDSGAAIIK